MERVRGVVQLVAVPGNSLEHVRFWLHRTVPNLDLLLVRSNVVDVAQANRRHADEATLLDAQHAQQALDDVWLQKQVIVEEEDERRPRLRKKELTLLRHAPSVRAT